MKKGAKKYTYKGVSQDIADSKHSNEFLFDAMNMRFTSTGKKITGGISFEKGNALNTSINTISIDRTENTITYEGDFPTILTYTNGNEIDTDITIPTFSDSQIIIGGTSTRTSVILFSTDGKGMDCIWQVYNDTNTLELVYLRNLNFSIENPIQAIFNYENENIQKIYWIDGRNQMRTLNLKHHLIEGNEALIDIDSTTINFVGTIDFSQPIIEEVVSGGTHTAGVIQYGYNLYNLYGAQTKLSPLSELVPLTKGDNLGGGAVNEQVGSVPKVKITDIDNSFTHIKVYAIKYTSYNEIPSITVIDNREIGGQSEITVYDDGSGQGTLSLEELLFLGSDPYIPKHIETKDNNLLMFNVTTKYFELPEELDCRAYSFPEFSNTTKVFDNITSTIEANESSITVTDTNFNIPYKHDSINLNYDTRAYLPNSVTPGGLGKYIKYTIAGNQSVGDPESNQYFKDREIYRIGIKFYNRLGQVSTPRWIGDFKAPARNLQGFYNTLEVELTPEFYVWLNTYQFENEDDKPVGYKIIRANRTINDRTIICQGILSSMMVNSPRNSPNDDLFDYDEKIDNSNVNAKLPNFLIRNFEDLTPLKANTHLEGMQFGSQGGTTNPLNEVQWDSSERKADTYQYTAMQQLYSPEIMFGEISVSESTKLRVLGAAVNVDNSYWGREYKISSKAVKREGKCLGKISPHAPGGTNVPINGTIGYLMDRGLISETNGSSDDKNVEFNQWFRDYTEITTLATPQEYHIYGKPEKTIRGQGRTLYNNDSRFEYLNSLEGFLSDGEDNFDDDGDLKRAIVNINSYAAECATMVLDNGTFLPVEPQNRIKLEDLFNNTGIGSANCTIQAELIKPKSDIYFSGMYKGNTYEDRKRTEYLEIGEYNDIAVNSVTIISPGDTFVQTYRFTRINKTEKDIYSIGVNQITEVVECFVETTIDLRNRNDSSIQGWESSFQPNYEDFHKYNTVYSQQPTLITSTDTDFTFKKVESFDTRVQATKTKTPNEVIDSWTDVLVNEAIDLEGVYGPINAVAKFKGNIFTYQDNGVALISINPRIQVQGSDGVGIELGTGNKLHDYKYITTNAGCINKWGVICTNSAMYFLDGLNKRIFQFTGQSMEGLSEVKGMHTYLINNLNTDDLRVDNPILDKGISTGHDQKNNDIYFTYNNEWTIGFNEFLGSFTGLYSYNSPIYIYNKENLFTINPNNKMQMYKTHAGEYNVFYGTTQLSSITLLANPEGDHECIFNNLEYKSEAINGNGVDINSTWEHIRAWNEFQDTGTHTINKIRKLNRKYRLTIPRHANSRDRIRNNWTYIKLSSYNTNKVFYVNHDIILHYIANHINIQ